MTAENLREDSETNAVASAGAAQEAVGKTSALALSALEEASFESKMASTVSIVEAGNAAVANGEGYAAVKKHVDAAYAILRTITPQSLAKDERSRYDEVQSSHEELSIDLAMMDEEA